MDDLQTSDSITFIPEQIEPVVYEVVEAVLKDKTFAESQVQGWIDTICSKISHTLIDTNKPFKYIVTAVIVQKNGTGLHIGHSTHWDISNDNAVVVRWPTEKKKDPNARLNCVVTVFGVAY